MFRNLFSLAVQGTLRKRRVSLITFLVLLLSFSCTIMSMSLTTSINETNREFRLSAFGGWYIAIPDGKEGDAAFLAEQNWAENVGHARMYCEIKRTGKMLGTVDDAYIDMARVELLAGQLPQNTGEIALTEEVMDLRGYTMDMVGQTVPLGVGALLAGQNDADEKLGIADVTELTLCGVINSYSYSWSFISNKQNRSTVGGIVTKETAERVFAQLDNGTRKAYSAPAEEPTDQYYVSVAPENRAAAIKACGDYMHTNRDAAHEDRVPCVNRLSFPDEESVASSSTLYAFLIAAVALVAVLCVYMMQLPAEVHSFAVLRSIGITKGQLSLLMLFESLLLAAPAMVLGVPLGALLTRLALRLLVYTESAPVQVSVPYDALKLLFLLWLLVIVLARLVIFLITVRTPLSGRMQMQEKKARSSRRFRRALIVLLLCSLGVTVVYTAGKAAEDVWQKERFAGSSEYNVTCHLRDAESDHAAYIISQEVRAHIEALPGVEYVENMLPVVSYLYEETGVGASISFDGLEERYCDFYCIDYDTWAESFQLSAEEAEAFCSGEIVLLCFPWGDGESLRPEGEILLRARDRTGDCVAELSAVPLVWQVPRSFFDRSTVIGYEPYTVICAEAYLKKLLSTMRPGTTWGCYEAGAEFGYQELMITTTENADDLSAARAIEMICHNEGLIFLDFWSIIRERVQTLTQELILLYACGGCIALVTLLLLASALALEAEQERRSFTILRVIGMSLRQMRRKVFGKALWRSVFAVAAGWALYSALRIRTQLALNEYTLAEAAKRAWSSFTYYGGGPTFIAALSAAMLAVLLGVLLLSKRGLKESTRLK